MKTIFSPWGIEFKTFENYSSAFAEINMPVSGKKFKARSIDSPGRKVLTVVSGEFILYYCN